MPLPRASTSPSPSATPNRKVVFLHGPNSVAPATTPDGALLGIGSFPVFTHEAKNTTVLCTVPIFYINLVYNQDEYR